MLQTNLNDAAKEIHQNAVDHGWWEQPRSFGEIIALCHSELSEALEEYRDDRPNVYFEDGCGECLECENRPAFPSLYCVGDAQNTCKDNRKPEGIAVELADCIIRILDYCGKEGIDIDAVLAMKHAYNINRPYKHGGKVC